VSVKGPSTALARRYARALLSLAVERGEAVRLRGELAEAVRLLGQHPTLLEALTHPAVGADKRRRLVAAVWRERGASRLLLRLLDLLATRDRVGLLSTIGESYLAQWNRQRGVISAEAVGAVALDPAQTAALAGAIGRVTGAEVELRASVVPEVLGGLCVRFGGRVYDGTVRARLRALRQRLVEPGPGA